MSILITEFIACRPVDWSLVGLFLPDRSVDPVDALAVEATCTLCGIPVWVEPMLQNRRLFGPVICFLCAIFALSGTSHDRRTQP